MTIRYRPTAAYVTALRFAEDGSNWREFFDLCGWDMEKEREHWWPTSDPDTLRDFSIITVDSYGDEHELTIKRGDWLVVTDGGKRCILPDGIFQTFYGEFT